MTLGGIRGPASVGSAYVLYEDTGGRLPQAGSGTPRTAGELRNSQAGVMTPGVSPHGLGGFSSLHRHSPWMRVCNTCAYDTGSGSWESASVYTATGARQLNPVSFPHLG